MFTNITEMLSKSDVQRYISLVESGGLYEDFIKSYHEAYDHFKTRDEIKVELFTVLFSTNYSKNNSKDLFKKMFPTVDTFFRKIKQGNYKVLSILLQRIESDMILDDICMYANQHYPDMPVYTIHDSIATSKTYFPLLKIIMEERFMARIGRIPKLKEEIWCLNNIERELIDLKLKINLSDEHKQKVAA